MTEEANAAAVWQKRNELTSAWVQKKAVEFRAQVASTQHHYAMPFQPRVCVAVGISPILTFLWPRVEGGPSFADNPSHAMAIHLKLSLGFQGFGGSQRMCTDQPGQV